jgi:hypothetical protein
MGAVRVPIFFAFDPIISRAFRFISVIYGAAEPFHPFFALGAGISVTEQS